METPTQTNFGLISQTFQNNPYKTNKFYSTQAIIKNTFLGTISSTTFHSHFNPIRRVWEYIILFSSLVSIMEILFITVVDPEIQMSVYSISFIFDILFIADIFIVARTAILHNDEIVTKPKKIIKVYGKWTVIIQIISCIPLGWIGIILHNKYIYLGLSVNKLIRLYRGYRAFSTATTLLPYVGGPMSILPVIFLIVFSVDIFSTIFLGIAESQNFQNSWIVPYKERGFSNVQCFFVAVYFVMTTLLTIGFGDISPVSTPEIAMTIIIQLLGVSMHAVLTSMMVAILIDPVSAEFVQHYKVMQDYLTFKKIKKKYRESIHNYYQYQYERSGDIGDIKRILKTLPVSLKSTIKLEMTKTFFQLTKSFSLLSNKQLVRIVDVMTFKTFSPNDIIQIQGEKCDRIFFFKSGIVSVIIDGRNVLTQSCSEGVVNGEYEMFLGMDNPTGMEAVTYVESWILKIEDVMRLMQTKEDIRYLILKKLNQEYPDRFQKILTTTIPDENMRASIEEMLHNNNPSDSSDESGMMLYTQK